MQSEILQARVHRQHLAKMAEIRQKTGLTTSQIFRQLIERAEIEPAKIAVNLSIQTESAVPTLSGQHGAFAA